MTGTYFICCDNLETKLPEHYKVPYSIYVYVRQLENQIYKLNNPNCDIKKDILGHLTLDLEEFRIMVEKGTILWKDVPDDWLEDLRGNDETV